jgi:hypothetical protein
MKKTECRRLHPSTAHCAGGIRTLFHVSRFWRVGALIVSVALGVSACAVSAVPPLTVPLVYQPSPKQAGLVAPFACSAVVRVRATDARSDKTLGVRVHESKPLKAEVSASGDAGSWVEQGVQRYLQEAGIRFQGGGPTLIVSLDSLRTSESIWHRSSYDARITLSSRLQAPAGRSCWADKTEGKSGNYGYSGSIVDYQETLNGALDAATLGIAESQGFRNALCHCSD